MSQVKSVDNIVQKMVNRSKQLFKNNNFKYKKTVAPPKGSPVVTGK